MASDLVVNSSLTIPEADLGVRAVRSSGPGGQNVNKVSTKIELRFDLRSTSALRPEVKVRLRRLAASRLDAEGALVITSQATRSQAQNLEDARAKLADLIRAALFVPKRRRPTKPTRASKERRLDAKRHQSQKKQTRGSRDE
ncbi:MAG: aminoacyl-tRNA hydrolase [Myxococcales bacterium]|nr:aminoacyl-tRNA hydrolase [Myxococcales bacterium]